VSCSPCHCQHWWSGNGRKSGNGCTSFAHFSVGFLHLKHLVLLIMYLFSTSKSFVQKKAALTLLRLYRKHADVIPAQEWAERIIALMSSYDLVSFSHAGRTLVFNDMYQGVCLSVTTLVMAFAQNYPNEYIGCYEKAVQKLKSASICVIHALRPLTRMLP
jgi:hypothetical protein